MTSPWEEYETDVKNPPPVLPECYYLAHFREILSFVAVRYRSAFDPEHLTFLDDFAALSDNAACLYVRFVSRRGRVFRKDKLHYAEISLDSAGDELLQRGFAREPVAGDVDEILRLKDKSSLIACIRTAMKSAEAANMGSNKQALPRLSSLKKAELVEFALTVLGIREHIIAEEEDAYWVQMREEEVAYLFYLYFGTLGKDLSTFALRDLGRREVPRFRRDFEARFATGEEARVCFFYSRLLEKLDGITPEEALSLATGIEHWPLSQEPDGVSLRHRTLYRLGQVLEKAGEMKVALDVYLRSNQHPATERSVRLLHATERHAEAQAMLHRLLRDPSCEVELSFAEDFLARKYQNKKVSRLSEMLRSGPVYPLEEAMRGYPEQAVAGHLHRAGVEAAFVENHIWHQLFGLLFWDLLFGPEHSSLYDPFDVTPQDLRNGTFGQRHAEAIAERLRLLDDAELACRDLQGIWDANQGAPNHLVSWEAPLFEYTLRLVQTAPKGALAAILADLATDFRHNRAGFPDLVVFKENGVRFIEVKAEGDQLRRAQFAQIQRLRHAGFEVEVARVVWTTDPDQDYVIVDLETTGAETDRHRITEIAAVRVRSGKIVDEWTTLVNPGRSIPPFIAKLTGITNEMVSTAPKFEEVAESFREFFGDAIFVAHRAKFDHGFLKCAYERMGKDFDVPVVCSYVESRRHFPGLKKYGLAALCEHFAIPLDTHHRALCDARATAALFLKIQEKRRENAI